jgi:hypothetical protein
MGGFCARRPNIIEYPTGPDSESKITLIIRVKQSM